jgi:predicted peptidase
MLFIAQNRCAAFPDGKYEINDIAAQDDLVWVHYTAQGTFKARFMDVDLAHCEPSGKLEKEEGIWLLRFKDGKIVDWWAHYATTNGCLYIAGHKPSCDAIVRQGAAATPVPAVTTPPTPGEQVAQSADLQVQQGGQTRTVTLNYLLYLPVDYENQPGQRFPLILFLHGVGEAGNNLELLKVHGIPKLVDEGKDYPFIAASPQLRVGMAWMDQVDVLASLIKSLESQYRIDTKRIYVIGISLGGNGVWQFALTYPDIPAAIAPIAGWYGAYGSELDVPANICDLKNLPIWVFHGAADTTVSPQESQVLVDALKACGSDVKFTLYPGADHDKTFQLVDSSPELFDWLLAQSK